MNSYELKLGEVTYQVDRSFGESGSLKDLLISNIKEKITTSAKIDTVGPTAV